MKRIICGDRTESLTLSNRKVKIPAFGSLVYSRNAEISAWKIFFNVKNNVVSGSFGSGDPTLWELRGERVNPLSFWASQSQQLL